MGAEAAFGVACALAAVAGAAAVTMAAISPSTVKSARNRRRACTNTLPLDEIRGPIGNDRQALYQPSSKTRQDSYHGGKRLSTMSYCGVTGEEPRTTSWFEATGYLGPTSGPARASATVDVRAARVVGWEQTQNLLLK